MSLYKDKYRIESTRLKGYDYSSAGLYFVTVCTKGRRCCLGEVAGKEVRLSRPGEIVRDAWLRTPILRPNVALDEWVIMPNHIHGIINIKESIVETHSSASPRGSNRFGPQRMNLGSIVRGFKSSSTKQMHLEGFLPLGWQPNYYEHVIRDGTDLDRIREYIIENPFVWNLDENHPGNIRMDLVHRGIRDWSALD
jgi:putative transposase